MQRSNRRRRKRPGLYARVYVMVLSLILGLSLVALLRQEAFATTYVITDGDQTLTCTTFATDPAEVLDKAGLSLGESDSYTTEAVAGRRTITVQRGATVTVHYHGQTTTATSSGETAGELLKRLNLDVSGEDVVCPGLDTYVYDGMELRIDEIVTLQETYTAALPHAVSYCDDATLPEGTQAVLSQGVDGELLRTAGVTYVNGEEAERVVLTEKVTRAPVREIIALGTAREEAEEPGPIIADGYITLPSGEVLTYTHTATIRATAYTHTDAGCDMVTATGTNVHWGTVAVDPRYIPYGTRMFIVSNDGEYVYGIAVAEDCGGDIKGDRMDLYMPTYEQCIAFGRRTCTLYFLG